MIRNLKGGIELRLLKYGFVIIILIVVILLFFKHNNSNRFIGLAFPGIPQISPSENYQLQVVKEFNGSENYYRFDIIKTRQDGLDPEIVYRSKDTFRTRDTTYFTWDDTDDKVWVYSGDIGTFYWSKISDTAWEKHIYTEKIIPVPKIFKKLRPKFFK